MMKGLMMKYFVLKPKGIDPYARASRVAMRSYAYSITSTNRKLSDELIIWAREEEKEAKQDEADNRRSAVKQK